MDKYSFEIRQIDAWRDVEGGWTYNETWHICNVKSGANDVKRMFSRQLNRRGITFKKNRTRIEYDGSIYEVIDRKTKEPLFCMIPEY